jgi:hypothetical protein
MDSLLYNFYQWGILLQIICVVHWVRRRPEFYWLWIIIIGGALGSLAYILIEMLPDVMRGGAFSNVNFFERHKRIKQLEAIIRDNPAPGNLEDLALMYLEDGKYATAKEYYDRAIGARTDAADPFYRRAICEIELGQFPQALEDLQRVVGKDPKYDFLRAQGLLAHAYVNTGNPGEAERLFASVTQTSTISETMYNYAEFLAKQGRPAEARDWARKVVDKKPTLPGYLKRRERPWFRKADALLKQLPA